MSDTTEGRLRRVFAGVLRVEAEGLEPGSSPETVETWDSLAHLMLVSAVESEFGVSLTIDEVIEMASFAKALAVVEHAVAARGP